MRTISNDELLKRVATEFQTDHYVQRSPVTMSMLGKCRRQVAYALSGEPGQVIEESDRAAAWLGTVIHESLLGVLGHELHAKVEEPVTLDLSGLGLPIVEGTADLVLDEQVVDLKTVSSNYYPTVAARTPLPHRLQATGYGMATEAQFCTLLYVNRGDGKRFAVSWPTEEWSGQVVDWLRECTGDPKDTPRDERGPGLSIICDECPWQKQCWGPVTEFQEPQGVRANEESVEMALLQYVEAREREATGKADREFWRKVLTGAADGIYGEWMLTWGRPAAPKLDTKEATRLLEEAGLPLPITGGGSVSIRVARHRE